MKTKLKIKSLLLVALLPIVGCQEQESKNSEALIGLIASSSVNQSKNHEFEKKKQAVDDLIKDLELLKNRGESSKNYTEDSISVFAKFMRFNVEVSEIKESAEKVGELSSKDIEILASLDVKSERLVQQLKDLESSIEMPEKYKNQMEKTHGKQSRFGFFETTRQKGWVCYPYRIWMFSEFWPAAINCWWIGFINQHHTWLSFETIWF